MQPGLTTQEAENLLQKYGINDVVENRTGAVRKFLAPLYSPIALMLLGAAFLSLLNNEIFDFYFILALYVVNYAIQKWQEFKADKAIKELQGKLSFDVSAFRDGEWRFINAKQLARRDRIRLGLGSIIPADARIITSNNLSTNEAALTGESMPKEKNAGDTVYSGSFIATGSFEAEILLTGKDTFFGKTIFSIEQPTEKSILEKDILYITRFLTAMSIMAVLILTTVFLLRGFPVESLLTLDLSLIIAGIPIALPAVMAIILSIGAGGLAKKLVVVRRLSALQDLANVNLLLTDKTGTLTKNKISITNVISYEEGLSTKDIVLLASYATSPVAPDQIDSAIAKRLEEDGGTVNRSEVISFIPYDADRKRTTALIQTGSDKILISIGAPQVIRSFDGFSSPEMTEKFEKDIEQAGAEGYRVLAIAIKKDGIREERMKVVGLLFLSDPLDETSKATIHFMQQNGIGVKMLTGDNKVISERILRELGLSGKVLSADETRKLYSGGGLLKKEFDDVVAFSEISPKDKYEIVKAFKAQYVVASTGDGINDLPALKVANVGIAVSGAVSALKSLADIVLLGPGISVIRDAVLESRKIFVRLYNYSVYRISESFRLIITILILGLWYGSYPLVPLQLILLAFLNDIPIISLAVDRVKILAKPSEIKAKERFVLSMLFGTVGVCNSILLFIIMNNLLHLSLPVIQTIFFLKLTVSGHALIFVSHTKERWYRYLPSKEVIIATVSTQLIATTLAVTGFLMPSNISISAAVLVWAWAFLWMQVSELMKDIQMKYSA
jgi:H+-transporting ATPase